MAISDRYPTHAPGAVATYGVDLSPVLPPGTGLSTGTVAIVVNTNPVESQSDWTIGAVSVRGRRAWCQLAGGAEGTDYQIRWSLADTLGGAWPVTCYVLCAQTT